MIEEDGLKSPSEIYEKRWSKDLKKGGVIQTMSDQFLGEHRVDTKFVNIVWRSLVEAGNIAPPRAFSLLQHDSFFVHSTLSIGIDSCCSYVQPNANPFFRSSYIPISRLYSRISTDPKSTSDDFDSRSISSLIFQTGSGLIRCFNRLHGGMVG